MKKCTKCGVEKPLSEFYKRKNTKDLVDSWCKPCCRQSSKALHFKNRSDRLNKMRTRKYGILPKEFEQKIIDQKGACDICKIPFDPNKTPFVDHNHNTNAVRGLLCLNCNTGLGVFKESFDILKSAQDYLQKYNSESQEK